MNTEEAMKQRNSFLMMGCLILMSGCVLVVTECQAGDPTPRTVTILVNSATVKIEQALVDGEHLWVVAEKVHEVNEFISKPEGFCTDEVCIPIPKSTDWRMQYKGKDYFNVTRFAAKVDQVVAVDESKTTWSFGKVPILRSRLLLSGLAPDFELPDRKGKKVKLSDFRGKKVLILTWASW